MSTARRLSTNPDAVTAWPGRVAVALALSVATLPAMPAAAEAQDITVRFERSAESVHEGDPLGLSIQFSEIPDRVIPDGDWYVTIPFTVTEKGGARRYGIDYWSFRSVKVYRDRGFYWAGFQFGATADSDDDPGESVLFEFGTFRAGSSPVSRRPLK